MSLTYYFCFFVLLCNVKTKAFITCVLDPAGDAQYAGRTLPDGFERGTTLQLCQTLKKGLEHKIPHIRVIISRTAGDIKEPLQNAQYANQINADLYVSIHAYSHEEAPTFCIYTFNDATGPISMQAHEIPLVPFNKAYSLSSKKSEWYAQELYQYLQTKYQKKILVQWYKVPFKPLVGISVPAFGIECNINEQYSWNSAVPVLLESIEYVLKKNIIDNFND